MQTDGDGEVRAANRGRREVRAANRNGDVRDDASREDSTSDHSGTQIWRSGRDKQALSPVKSTDYTHKVKKAICNDIITKLKLR